MSEFNDLERQTRKERLLEYYKIQATSPKTDNKYDLDSSEFDYEAYLKRILKEESLMDLMDKEKELMTQIRNLDSEMQTLVYDNYNKFIFATDTIKNMKTNFQYVEDEMNQLGQEISAVNSISKKLQNDLTPKRDELKKLYGTHQLLKRLEYLFELPDRLRTDINNKQFMKAVRSHSKAQSVLDRYHDLPSFEGIRRDCNEIISDLQKDLWHKFERIDIDVQELSSAVMILLQLNQPRPKLAEHYLSNCSKVMHNAFASLKNQMQNTCNPQEEDESGRINEDENSIFLPDILHFANITTELVLDRLSTQISVYNELFLNDELSSLTSQHQQKLQLQHQQQHNQEINQYQGLLLEYLNDIVTPFIEIVQTRLNREKELGDTTMLARAMDRLHSRLQALQKLVPQLPSASASSHKQVDLSQIAMQLVCNIARDRSQFYSGLLARQLSDCVTDIRQRLSVSQVGSGGSIVDSTGSTSNNNQMQKLLNSLSDALVDQLKATLNAQQAFIDTDNTFSKKPQFQISFCIQDIRESLFMGFIKNIISYCSDLANQSNIGSSFCPLLLILGRLCQNWADQGVLDYLLTIVDEQFLITVIKHQDIKKIRGNLTDVQSLADQLRDCSVQLVNSFVRIQGNSLSQMIRKSVDTRDWLNCVEPRSVRSVMKRLVEDMAQIDIQVSQLLPSNTRLGGGDQSSDHSSRRRRYNYSHLIPTGAGGGGGVTNNNNRSGGLVAMPSSSATGGPGSSTQDRFLNNISKLFAEKIKIFAPVVALRESVLTGIVRIALKTFMECVRLKTFGKYGLQQIQVDCRYLQIHLWRFVDDEKLIHILLDDVISSVVNRCVDPLFMEESIIELVCES